MARSKSRAGKTGLPNRQVVETPAHAQLKAHVSEICRNAGFTVDTEVSLNFSSVRNEQGKYVDERSIDVIAFAASQNQKALIFFECKGGGRRLDELQQKASSWENDIRRIARGDFRIISSTTSAFSVSDFTMTILTSLAAVAVGTVLVTSAALCQTAREIRGATPYVAIQNEPAPKLIVDPPLPEGLAIGVFWAQHRVENLHIAPVFGPGALQISPRVGHLHVIVDDLPWWWADASDNNTIDIANLPPGQHKVKIKLVNANHEVIPGQSRTITFTIPPGAAHSHPD